MPLTILDGIVIVVILISAILAMVRGFVREVLSVASWVAAAAAAYLLYKPVMPIVQPYFESKTVTTVVAAAGVFFVALIIASFVTMKISDFVIDSRIGMIDRILGFLFGAVRGLLLMVIALLFFGWLVKEPPTWVTQAATRPMLDHVGSRLMEAMPKDFESSLLGRLRGTGGGNRTDTNPAEDGAEEGNETPRSNSPLSTQPPETGYGTGTRRSLDQLFQNNAAPNQ